MSKDVIYIRLLHNIYKRIKSFINVNTQQDVQLHLSSLIGWNQWKFKWVKVWKINKLINLVKYWTVDQISNKISLARCSGLVRCKNMRTEDVSDCFSLENTWGGRPSVMAMNYCLTEVDTMKKTFVILTVIYLLFLLVVLIEIQREDT